MTSTVAIAGRTVIYPSGLQSALTLKNVGAETVYLDSQANVNTGGFPLGVNSSMVWDANRPLYAYAGNGQLLVSENSGNLFDAQAVAAEIIAGGLAGDIAAQIALNGAPPIDQPVLLYSNNSLGVGTWSPVLNEDVRKYQSIWVMANCGAAGQMDIVEYSRWAIGLPPSVQSAFCGNIAGVYNQTTVGFPVRGAIETLQFYVSTGAWSVSVFASTRPLAEMYYANNLWAQPDASGGILAALGNVKDIAPHVCYTLTGTDQALHTLGIPHRYGRHELTITNLSTNASAALFCFKDMLTGVTIDTPLSITNAKDGQKDVFLPARPCVLSYDLVGAQSSFTITLIPY